MASCALSHGSRDLSIVARNPRVADMILSAERVPGRIFLSMIEGVAGVGLDTGVYWHRASRAP